MHSRRSLLKARLATVRRDLDEAMARLKPEWLDWAPEPGMRTVSGQLVEIIGTEIQLVTLLRDDRWITDPEARILIGDCDDLDVLRRAADRVRGDTLAYLDDLSEDALAEEIEFGGGWFGSLGLATIPRPRCF